MINIEQISELYQDFGKEDFMDLLGVYSMEFEAGLSSLDEATDSKIYREQIHALRGASLNMGFSDLGDMLGKIENQIASGQETDITWKMKISDSYKATKNAVVIWLEGQVNS